MYDKLVAKVNNIDTSGFAIKTKYNEDKPELENKIPDTSGLVQMSDYDAKITEIEGKIPDVSNLVRETALITVENKIPDVTNLVKKIMILKLQKLKISLIIIIMTNTLLLQSLIL